MSLLEMMLDDRRIMLALAVALAPLALAALLGVVLQIRRLVQQRAAHRAADEARALVASVGVDAPDELPRTGEMPAAREIAVSTPDAGDAGEPPSEVEDEGAPEDTNEGAASVMQALLDSVFTEEEFTNPLAHLLDELDDIQAADLAALCERVAAQLGQAEA